MKAHKDPLRPPRKSVAKRPARDQPRIRWFSTGDSRPGQNPRRITAPLTTIPAFAARYVPSPQKNMYLKLRPARMARPRAKSPSASALPNSVLFRTA